jgi:outer membrane usher protein
LQPCLSIEQLKQWGVKTALFPSLPGKSECANLQAIPQASTDFQFGAQRLVISIPQAAIDLPREAMCRRRCGMRGSRRPCSITA